MSAWSDWQCDAITEEDYRFEMRREAMMDEEQEEIPFRCRTCIKHTENGICHRWMKEVKDDDYCSFGESRQLNERESC